ncbi:uncharacterized protein LOC111031052 [Myzus persicae]|uniref:uncharacterized protein LOC111031052 n=1 Tax=Myzus persicae TaxID=13164 RepID=UPI000B93453E|nr:uncharacterized protein LOC111031052 [Myzus persicae]
MFVKKNVYNYDEAAKKEREVFLSASESDRSYKKAKPNNFSSRKNLFGSNDNINDSDSSDNDQPLMVIKKKNDEAKSLISNAITGIQEESCNYSFEPNSLGSMSSIYLIQFKFLFLVSNYDKHPKTILQKSCEARNVACSNEENMYNIDQSSVNISQEPTVQMASSTYMLSAMNTLLNMNDQNVNVYESASPLCSENTTHNSQFSTPRPLLSASAIVNNNSNNFSVSRDAVQSNILNIIYEQGIETNAYLKRIDGRLDCLEKIIKNMSGTQNHNNPVDNAFLTMFPLKDIDSLKDFDTRITNDPDFKLNVINFITRIGGTDIKNFIKRVLQRIFSNELSSKCSWTGFRNNYRLENIWFMSIMKDLSREKFNSSDLDFELHVKDWFRHGSQ